MVEIKTLFLTSRVISFFSSPYRVHKVQLTKRLRNGRSGRSLTVFSWCIVQAVWQLLRMTDE